jgi:hypothetical protein
VIPRGFTAKPGVGFGIGAIKGSYTAGSCPAVSEKLHRSCSLQRDTCTLEEQSAISEESRGPDGQTLFSVIYKPLWDVVAEPHADYRDLLFHSTC